MKLFTMSLLLFTTVHGAPEWSPTYSVSGTLNLPYASKDVQEPVSAWYDAPNNRSRVDYYGGKVKTIQLGNVGKYGTSFKVVPVGYKVDVFECEQIFGTENDRIKPVSVLPSLDNFINIGNEDINGENTEKWEFIVINDNKKDVHSFWLKYVDDPNNSKNKIPYPVKYEIKGYNTYLEKQYDYYYLEYDNYKTNQVEGNVFETDGECTSFSNPDVEQIEEFNPLRQYIYPTSDDYVEYEFEKFVIKFSRDYVDDKERAVRKELFRQNLRFVDSLNRAHLSYTVTINQFSDRRACELPHRSPDCKDYEFI